MFPSSFFPPSSLLSDPFFDWDSLLQRQWQEQQAFRQQLLHRQQQHHLPNKSVNDCSTACANLCAGNKLACQPKDNCSTACANLCKIYHPPSETNNKPSSTSTYTAVTPVRSFSDLTIWSDLTPQQIQLEWCATEPSAKEYVVSAYLPTGMTPTDTNISIDELSRLLTVKCQTKLHQEEKDADGNIISSRSSSNATERSIQVPSDVDLRGISASKYPAVHGSMPQAQLILHLPKLQQPLSKADNVKQIPIH